MTRSTSRRAPAELPLRHGGHDFRDRAGRRRFNHPDGFEEQRGRVRRAVLQPHFQRGDQLRILQLYDLLAVTLRSLVLINH